MSYDHISDEEIDDVVYEWENRNQPNQYEDKELEQRVNDANTIPELDKLRMNIVESKSRKLLTLWQEKYWERKKKYSYAEVQQLITQKQLEARIEALEWAQHNADDVNYSISDELETLRKEQSNG